MLETKNLRKVYTPKKGVPVTALDGVSLKFPERGMVFLLGKSGSGKSTLLNLLGGLDKYDEGEIIIKGVSSRDFSQERFDSYRNTYVGFIFQDYNILEEFSVGANIALAIELQGKKATDAEINKILEEVDLVGYGNRKPNELSGGQLQRVAIARALIKDPEIIMADEPTGALDSGTGKQVFDTLKKLSADKLVIIVSHDREYAEFYADRIIELADGHVISDVEYAKDEGGAADSLSFDGDTVTVPAGYHLTEEDRAEINAYIDRIKSGTKLHFSGLTKKFRNTDTSAIPPQDPSKFALIKSRLPLHSAFRIGASGLKHKKFRLAVTVVLSVVAFTLFALADTFGAYDHITTCTDSLVDSGVNYLSFNKAKKYIRSYDGSTFWDDWGYKLEDSDIAEISEGVGVPVSGVYTPDRRMESPSFMKYVDQDISLYSESNRNIYPMMFGGFTEASKEVLDSAGCTLTAGRLPEDGKHELAITEYTATTFRLGGFSADGGDVYDKIAKSSDMIGRTLNLCGIDFEIVGIIDTHFDIERYRPLTKDDSRLTEAEQLTMYVLMNELADVQTYSLDNLAYVSRGVIAELASNEPPVVPTDGFSFYIHKNSEDFNFDTNPSYVGKLTDIPDSVKDRIIWADGKPRDTLGEKEVVVSSNVMFFYDFSTGAEDVTSDMYDTFFGLDLDAEIYSGISYDTYEGYRIVGIIDWSSDSEGGSVVYPDTEDPGTVDELMENEFTKLSIYLPDALYNDLTEGYRGIYASAVGAMPESEADVRRAVSFAYREDADTRFPLQNPVTYELDVVNEILEELSVWFLWIGVGFAVFAAIMLANFIGTSIAYKKQEIGILRAIGSRSSDVFHIFFAEGFIIAVTNFVLASIATFAATAVINGAVRSNVGLLITVLHFGIRQTALLIAVSLAVAAISCFLPVKRIASKRPIDAIRGR